MAAKDLKVLWTSPLPWVVGALLQLVLGFLFINELTARGQALAQPLFPLAGFLLLAMLPILAMRSFADEARTGTLDLLQAIPVPARVLVVGKWLAVWLTAVLALAPALALVGLVEWFGEPDPGPVAAGFAGLVLFSAALSGIGVLASALTTSQPVAAMVAFFTTLALWFAHAGEGAVGAGGLLLHFSVSERLRTFAGGGIDTADVAFFAVLTLAALVLAGVAVDGRRLR